MFRRRLFFWPRITRISRIYMLSVTRVSEIIRVIRAIRGRIKINAILMFHSWSLMWKSERKREKFVFFRAFCVRKNQFRGCYKKFGMMPQLRAPSLYFHFIVLAPTHAEASIIQALGLNSVLQRYAFILKPPNIFLKMWMKRD